MPDSPHTADIVERVARAICEANGEMWKEGTYEVASGPNFEMEDHPLDPFNNHWRHMARAAIDALPPDPEAAAEIKALREALERIADQIGTHVQPAHDMATIARNALKDHRKAQS